MNTRIAALTVLSLAPFSLPTNSLGATPGFPQHPTLSPDGSTVVFSWAGDLWATSAKGGPASRLTAHPADDTRSAFSPDGSALAFESNRDGQRNLYVFDVQINAESIVATNLRRVTNSARGQTLGGFTPDGSALVFSGRQDPSIYRHDRIFRAPLDGSPVARVSDAFGKEPAVARDGSVLFTRGFNIWGRPVYRGSGSMDLYRYAPGDGSYDRLTFDAANDGMGYQRPDGSVVFVSSRDGQNNVWTLRAGASDRDAGALTQHTRFAPQAGQVSIGHGVRDLSVSADGSTAVFAVWDTLYTLDLNQPGAEPRALAVSTSDDDDRSAVRRMDLDNEVTEALLSPDGQTLAVIARGEVFVRNAEDDHPTRRVTDSPWRERELAWSPDGQWLYFVTDEPGLDAIARASVTLTRDDLTPDNPEATEDNTNDDSDEPEGGDANEDATGDQADEPGSGDEDAASDAEDNDEKEDEGPDHGDRWAGALRFEVQIVANDPRGLRQPTPSPDGLSLLAIAGRGDLVRVDAFTGAVRTLDEHWDTPSGLAWVADGRHAIFAREDLDHNSDVWLMDVENPSAMVNLTRHPDYDASPVLSRDGKVLVFLSDRAAENWDFDVHAIYLDASLEGLRQYELTQHFEDAAKAMKKAKPIDTIDPDADQDGGAEDSEADEPFEFDTEDAFLRVRRLTSMPASESNLALTPAGDRVIFQTTIDGDAALFSVDHTGGDREQIAKGRVSDTRVDLTGAAVSYVRSGQARTGSPSGGKETTLSIDAPVQIDVVAQQRQKLLEISRVLGTRFYHPTLKGLDWDALTARYLALAEQTRTSRGFNRVARMFIDHLDASHLGVWGGDAFSASSPNTGYLGAHTEPAPGGFRVTGVRPQSPASRESSRLEPGDLITAVGGVALAPDASSMPTVDLIATMAGTAGRETLLDIVPADPERAPHVLITPVSSGADVTLAYNEEVERRRAEVEKLSAGKLGYLHIRSMGAASVREFERDLYAAAHGKEGLIIDVRDNGGGWTTDILLASLTAPRHAYTIPRGASWDRPDLDAYPRDRRLIYGYYEPITVLINQHSFSNAEIFSHAIKTTGRGKLVGTQTFGGVISTGARRLIDGSTVRMPFRGWFLPDGTDMDVYGAEPDLNVPQTPEDEAEGRDPQLEAAVMELLQRVSS